MDNTTMMRQAHLTALEYHDHLNKALEERGYTKAERLALLPSMIQAASLDYVGTLVAQTIEEGTERIAGAIQ